ncbi:EEF1A lysine methyltransferase 1 [Prorops nasuta]|uniref:EEF1A lysine methyltransferase 1 n=1 Tax=Prorops nasuta TaxID=863751 RepID=UPI0034CD2053
MSDICDDDNPQLSKETKAILEQFLAEKRVREEEMQLLSNSSSIPSTFFEEDWQLSQFWYNEETIDTLIRGALNVTNPTDKIALISCPTLYSKLKSNCGDREINIFEYDQRFKVYGQDFIPYDYKYPLQLPRNISSNYDLVIADPPFLSEECLTKISVTIKHLSKRHIIICTGAVMEDFIKRLMDVKKCDFQPSHRNNLANEFYCYSNFDFDKVIK